MGTETESVGNTHRSRIYWVEFFFAECDSVLKSWQASGVLLRSCHELLTEYYRDCSLRWPPAVQLVSSWPWFWHCFFAIVYAWIYLSVIWHSALLEQNTMLNNLQSYFLSLSWTLYSFCFWFCVVFPSVSKKIQAVLFTFITSKTLLHSVRLWVRQPICNRGFSFCCVCRTASSLQPLIAGLGWLDGEWGMRH